MKTTEMRTTMIEAPPVSAEIAEEERLVAEEESGESSSVLPETFDEPSRVDVPDPLDQVEMVPAASVEPTEEWLPMTPDEISTDPTPGKPAMELGALRALAAKQKGQHRSGSYAEPPREGVDPKQFLDDFGDGRVRNFDDMFAHYPIGNGEFQVYVERKHPRTLKGINIGGIQRPIEQVMDHTTFAARYGSGTYALTVYGPVPGKRKADDGQLRRKAYTRPIKIDVPDPFGENPPNPEMAAVAVAEEDVEEENNMTAFGIRRRGGATEADAEIAKAQLEHEAEKEERAFRREDMNREREEAKHREREEAIRTEESGRVGLLERMIRDKEAELKEMRSKRSESVDALSFVPELLRSMKPEGPSQNEIHRLTSQLDAERVQKSEELARLREAHNAEVHRIRDEHTKEIERLRSDFDRISRDERERNDRYQREKEENVRRQLEDARKDSDRQLSSMRESYEARLNDERRQHDRDLQTAQMMGNTNSTAMNSSFEMRLEAKQQEINRLQADLARVQSELDDEKSKTLADRVEEFSGAAEALGYSKDEGERGWKEMLGEAAAGLIQNVPTLAANIAALRGGPNVPMLPQRSAGTMVPQPSFTGPAFATEGVDMDVEYPMSNRPIQDEEYEEVDEPPARRSQGLSQAPQQPVQQQQATPTQQPGGLNISDEQIVEFSEMFRNAMREGASPEDLAQNLVTQLGPMMSGAIVSELQLSRVFSVLQGSPGGDKDPLVRRNGKKFLTKVWELVKSKTDEGVAAQA